MVKTTRNIMFVKSNLLLFIVFALLTSCKNQSTENESTLPEIKDTASMMTNETNLKPVIIDTAKIAEQLQGKWKEIEFPYRTADFKNSTVKFIEEGTVNPPKFEKFEVSAECPFDNNNIRNLSPSDIILTLEENQRCEKLEVSGDTLRLSGFSTNTNEDYNIVYLKEAN